MAGSYTAAGSDSVKAEINFYSGTTNNEPLFTLLPKLHQYLPDGTPPSNGLSESRNVEIQSLLAAPHKFTLDKNGFQMAELESAVKDWSNTNEIRDVFYPEIEAMLKKTTGASRVYVFDHVTRGVEDKNGQYDSAFTVKTPPGPVLRAHVDFTERSAPQRVRRFLGDDADKVLQRRYAIVQVWKPLRGPVLASPLAIADASTVGADDLIPSYLVYPDRVGEVYAVKYNPNQRWYYYPRIEANQAYVFKCYDSVQDVPRFTPHTAFVNPNAPKDAPTRQSIDMRALVFWEDEVDVTVEE